MNTKINIKERSFDWEWKNISNNLSTNEEGNKFKKNNKLCMFFSDNKHLKYYKKFTIFCIKMRI